jgi:hypothetical protein
VDEREWLTSNDPRPEFTFLRDSDKLTERKARLFAVACCHRIWHLLTDARSRRPHSDQPGITKPLLYATPRGLGSPLRSRFGPIARRAQGNLRNLLRPTHRRAFSTGMAAGRWGAPVPGACRIPSLGGPAGT